MSAELTINIACPDMVAAIDRLTRAVEKLYVSQIIPNADTGIPVSLPAKAALPDALSSMPVNQPVVTQPVMPSPFPVMPLPTTTAVTAAPTTPAAPVLPTAPAVPTAPAPSYSMDQLQLATGTLMDRGPDTAKQLQGLLTKYGVERVANLPGDKYGEFAMDLRGLGAQI